MYSTLNYLYMKFFLLFMSAIIILFVSAIIFGCPNENLPQNVLKDLEFKPIKMDTLFTTGNFNDIYYITFVATNSFGDTVKGEIRKFEECDPEVRYNVYSKIK